MEKASKKVNSDQFALYGDQLIIYKSLKIQNL